MRRPLDGPKNVVSSKGPVDLLTHSLAAIHSASRRDVRLAKRNPESIVAGPRHMQRHSEQVPFQVPANEE